ncbi:MAG TPA: iron ABC transporter permease, partial [Ferruginibacter sp.]|nr:iron ABC transporter permease [Ferruginibacter sp.]
MHRYTGLFFVVLIVLLVVAMACGIAFGTAGVSLHEMWLEIGNIFRNQKQQNIDQAVFVQLRLPRVLLCAITGAILAVSGVLMQGMFRNPIVEPGMIGTSAGAAFGASIVFVKAPDFSPALKEVAGPLLTPIAAFLGALLATIAIYSLAKNAKRISIMSLLLVGIAINSICMSGVGFMSYTARDAQARSITFWNLGNFNGANWLQVMIVGGVAAIVFAISFRYSKQLNTLLLGEEEAGYLGVNPDKLKKRILLLNTIMVSVATAFVGVITFMGLIVPHVLRLLIGSDNKKLLPASMI